MQREQPNPGAQVVNLAGRRQTTTGESERPTPTPEVYTLLMRAILRAPEEDMELLHDTLNDVYKALGDTDPLLIEVLSRKQMDGVITSDDKLYLVVLCAISRAIGPFEVRDVRNALMRPTLPADAVDLILARINLDETIKKYLREVIIKIVS